MNTSCHELIVRCKRADIGTDHVKFLYKEDRVEIYPGNTVEGKYFIISFGHSETLYFDACEEAALMHDGVGWNLDELQAWIADLEIQGQFGENETAVSND